MTTSSLVCGNPISYLLRYYRGPGKSMQILLSNSQAGPDRTVKQEQEEILSTAYKLFPGALYSYEREWLPHPHA